MAMGKTAAGLAVIGAIIAIGACSGSKSGSDFQATPDAGSSAPITPGLATDAGLAESTATLNGTVYAPEGTIPIAGAVVYWANAAPGPIPDGTYCDKCISLPEGTYATTAADGTFSLSAPSEDLFLVVQKGQFRRVREFTPKAGVQTVDKLMTTLPGKMDKASGDDIPKMALIDADYDKIDETLGKLGLAGSFDEFTEGSGGANSQEALLSDPSRLAQYHFVFRGCSQCDDGFSSQGAYIANLQNYVKSGGKLYVTDWSYEYVHQGWPQYLTFNMSANSGFGGGCIGEYDAPATMIDPDMKNWLAAQSITSVTTEGNWSIIDKVNSVNTTDADGNPTTVTPHVWIAGTSPDGTTANTVSFEDGCGRVLFSTYHTEGVTGGGSTDFLPQEKALLYVLLEVSVCATSSGPPR
jgi:hypothetical protein